MNVRYKALGVHLFTATGAVFAMLAMLAAVDAHWSAMFGWLIVALIVDGVDGPMARRYHVKENWTAHDGVLMDLIIDYLTYAFIPAFALFKSGLLPGWTGWLCMIGIVYGSAIYYADTRMKTKDNSFSGFPGCWNMPVLVLFALKPEPWITALIIIVLTIAMFLPIKFVHPMRTERWRAITIPMTIAWIVCAAWAIAVNFHPQSWALWGLIVSSLWLMLAGAAQQFMPQRNTRA